MISNQILQNTIEGIKSISRVDLHVADTDGKIIASTSQLGDEFEHAIISFVTSPADRKPVRTDSDSSGNKRWRVYGRKDGCLPDSESACCI